MKMKSYDDNLVVYGTPKTRPIVVNEDPKPVTKSTDNSVTPTETEKEKSDDQTQ